MEGTPNFCGHKSKVYQTCESIDGLVEDLEAAITVRCIPSDEKKYALARLEECAMWARNAIVRHGVWHSEDDDDE